MGRIVFIMERSLDEKKLKPTIMFAIPMYGLGLHRKVYDSHIAAIATLTKDNVAKVVLTGTTNKMNLAAAENAIVRAALLNKVKPDYIFWTEQDMVLPTNTIKHLVTVAESNNLDIVSGVYFLRGNGQPCLYRKDVDFDKEGYGHAGMITFPKNSLFEVGCCGMGCVLIKTGVFEHLAKGDIENHIWFDDQEGKHGTDIYFYTKARRAGFKVWADSRLLIEQIDEDQPKTWGIADYKKWVKKTKHRGGFIHNERIW